jgi:uncharacterized membrane protein (DUF373 family)
MASIKTYAICPISSNNIHERVARINAAFTVILILVFISTTNIIPVVFLVVDFFLRASEFSRYSITANLSKGVARILDLDKKAINAGPKIFAARIGFFLSSLILITAVLKLYLPVYLLSGILGLFSFLESAFGICVACEIYPFVFRFLYKTRYTGKESVFSGPEPVSNS